jgi:hypothetical protein
MVVPFIARYNIDSNAEVKEETKKPLLFVLRLVLPDGKHLWPGRQILSADFTEERK